MMEVQYKVLGFNISVGNHKIKLTFLKILLKRQACLIDDGETFLLTGGASYINKVSRYNSNGWIEDLHDLSIGRRLHGCVKYDNNFGAQVSHK